ncbi:DUF1295 domain-containing protein [Desulfoprunum benzoelyticum]|uniref:Protein-S-isoprenylcysteine O-methyltransferase Ste14 n=1 Tax=Desulfoprunum benzoelyticum TaxID=1506996 RepID=A0A840V7U7_9BACT|nr:DUF1295 domain-containing protein [Desulfoprunum benzoelyticum]MBB5349061.1 protein-S-isoprenylcysteine O-methyltransferase Ste14 [Desulfoprunum benzoelyticum]MBM9530551.1 DUF1295 domain-containing protein [Desulfoprunum benzoelyticum]
MSLILLSFLWIGWCAGHSLLIDPVVIGAIESRVPGVARYYRLLYNALAFLTLVPLAIVTGLAGGPPVFAWQGWGNVIRILLLVCALLLFRGGAKQYDLQYVVGLKQLRTGKTPLLLTDSPDFSANGVFGLVRHPWYLGSLLLIWSALPVYPLPKFVAAVILSCYLVIGTLLEERKIIARHGERYRAYQQQVSMLFPLKWLKKKLE